MFTRVYKKKKQKSVSSTLSTEVFFDVMVPLHNTAQVKYTKWALVNYVILRPYC
jgi:hypothetical protein